MVSSWTWFGTNCSGSFVFEICFVFCVFNYCLIVLYRLVENIFDNVIDNDVGQYCVC